MDAQTTSMFAEKWDMSIPLGNFISESSCSGENFCFPLQDPGSIGHVSELLRRLGKRGVIGFEVGFISLSF